jgi:hypothetical protein
LGNGEAECFGGLEVYDEIELCRLLNGEITWLRALQAPVHVDGCVPVDIGNVRPVRHEASSVDVCPERIYRRQPALGHRVDELSTARHEEWGIGGVQHTLDAALSLEHGRKIVRTAHRHRFELHAQRACGGLRPLQLHCLVGCGGWTALRLS